MINTNNKVDKYVVSTTLKARGWTAILTKQFLPEPDKLVPNPHYKSGPPMRLYSISRIEATEATEAFIAALAKSRARAAAAEKGIATKQQKMREYIESLSFRVPRLPYTILLKQACDNYNERQADYFEAYERYDKDWQPATPSSDLVFLDRIVVNYLRHSLTSYDLEIGNIAGKVGASDAYYYIKSLILAVIAKEYPNLAAECKRQDLLCENNTDIGN